MHFNWTPLTEADARTIMAWHYEEPYTMYSYAYSEEKLAQMLYQRSPYYTAHNEQRELIGLFCYGTAAQVWVTTVPALYSEDKTLDVGLSMRPV